MVNIAQALDKAIMIRFDGKDVNSCCTQYTHADAYKRITFN